MYIPIERRNLERNLQIIYKTLGVTLEELGKYLVIVEYDDNFDDMVEYLTSGKNFKNVMSVIFDSATEIMDTDLTLELSEQANEARDPEDRKEKSLFKQVKLSQEGYGALAGNMIRLMRIFGNLSKRGKYVIIISRLDENPKWDRELSAAPMLKGKEFSKSFAGKCDFIGLVEPRVNEEQHIVYPPKVSFISDGSYLAKWTGKYPLRKGKEQEPRNMPLDLELILGTDDVPNKSKTAKEGKV